MVSGWHGNHRPLPSHYLFLWLTWPLTHCLACPLRYLLSFLPSFLDSRRRAGRGGDGWEEDSGVHESCKAGDDYEQVCDITVTSYDIIG